MAAFNRPQGQSDGNGALSGLASHIKATRRASGSEAAKLAWYANITGFTNYTKLNILLLGGHIERIYTNALSDALSSVLFAEGCGAADAAGAGCHAGDFESDRSKALVAALVAARTTACARYIRGIRCIESIRAAQHEGCPCLESSVRVVVENTLRDAYRDAYSAARAAALKVADGAVTDSELAALVRKVSIEEFNYLRVGSR